MKPKRKKRKEKGMPGPVRDKMIGGSGKMRARNKRYKEEG